jgi:pimeloyl-ACP methyl ester carboxylesterase
MTARSRHEHRVRRTGQPVACALALAMFVALAIACGDAAAGRAPRIRSAACPIGADANVTCGFLDVPESRADPAGRRISLFVQRLRARPTALPGAAPVLILEGGPGGSSGIADPEIGAMMASLDSVGEVVLLAQRGTLWSEPALFCGEDADADIRGLALGTDDPERVEVARMAAATCRARLIARGIDVSAYTTAASVDDIEDLRIALGFERWNLLGLSYGTRLALEVMRKYPGRVQSAVLAGPLPPQADLYGDSAANAGRAIDLLLDTCAVDPECPLEEPRATFLGLVEKLDRAPVDVQSEFLDGRPIAVRVDGGKIAHYLFAELYVTAAIPELPGLIGALADDDLLPAVAVPTRSRDPTFLSMGMHRSVQCAEELPFVDRDRAAALPAYLRGFDWKIDAAMCEAWDVEPAPPTFDQPVESGLPTLILVGEFDPITPPRWGQLIAETLAAAQVVVLPGAGHDAGTVACGRDLAVAFLHDPSATLDRECVEQSEPLDLWR